MIRKFFEIICLLSFLILTKGQTFDILPENMNPYEGGAIQFYKDLNEVMIKNNFKPCNNKMSEMFLAKIKVENGEGEIINDNLKDDCSTKLFINAFNEVNKQRKWKKNTEVSKDFSIIFYPIDYFENFKEGYTTEGLKKYAEFPGGMGEFRNQLILNLKKQKIKENIDSIVLVKFDVNREGILNNIKIEQPQDLDFEIRSKIIEVVKQINQKWVPETFRGVPIVSNFKIPIKL